MIKRLIVAAVMLMSMIGFLATMPVFEADAFIPANCRNSFLGLPAWYKYLDANSSCDITGPTKDRIGDDGQVVANDPNTSQDESKEFDWVRAAGYVAIAIVEILLRVASLVAVGFVMYGGFRYITSQGEPENAKSARQTIINALIGLVIAVVAASAVAFVGNQLGSTTAPPPPGNGGGGQTAPLPV
jgi:hypothetical protein